VTLSLRRGSPSGATLRAIRSRERFELGYHLSREQAAALAADTVIAG